mgnify:CR=1 FL=1
MAGGNQGVGGSQGRQLPTAVPYSPQPQGYPSPSVPMLTPAQIQAMAAQQQPQTFNTRPMRVPQGYADGGIVDAGFMQYPQQGQPNQPYDVPLLSGQSPAVQNDGGPDFGAGYAGSSMGFDNSGSDAGVGGQPVNQVQTPFQQGNKPLSLAQFQPQQGLQIAGNPTSQVVQRPQIK